MTQHEPPCILRRINDPPYEARERNVGRRRSRRGRERNVGRRRSRRGAWAQRWL